MRNRNGFCRFFFRNVPERDLVPDTSGSRTVPLWACPGAGWSENGKIKRDGEALYLRTIRLRIIERNDGSCPSDIRI